MSSETKAGLKAAGGVVGIITGFGLFVWLTLALAPYSFITYIGLCALWLCYIAWRGLYEEFLR
jgi:hypothetical protein